MEGERYNDKVLPKYLKEDTSMGVLCNAACAYLTVKRRIRRYKRLFNMTDLGIAEERIREYRKTFDSYDKKHNGHIAVEDVANCLRSAGFMPSVVEVENLLREVDTENNILRQRRRKTSTRTKISLKPFKRLTQNRRDSCRKMS
nr:unnamed protein product [Spirometra erinaceieuropaei]